MIWGGGLLWLKTYKHITSKHTYQVGAVEKLNNIVIKKSETKNEGRLMTYADIVKKVSSELVWDTEMILKESRTNLGIQDMHTDKVEVKCEEQKKLNTRTTKRD